MSTGYGWEGLRQVCATLLVPWVMTIGITETRGGRSLAGAYMVANVMVNEKQQRLLTQTLSTIFIHREMVAK